ncbi:hypothetical protein ABEF95_009292 [Exophiala dermatitidis]
MTREEVLDLHSTLASLPPVPKTAPRQHPRTQTGRPGKQGQLPILVALDDDPTGTQTCHDIIVLTVWDVPTLVDEFRCTVPGSGFFILTNSRALHPGPARKLITEICHNLQEAARQANVEFEVVLRGDSTLRGHFPLEPEAVEEVLGAADAWILCPFFLQGGRYTINDVHYVAEGDKLVPASQTPFAKDASFGYRSSNLREWVVEKSAGKIPPNKITSFSLDLIRHGGVDKVYEKLMSIEKGAVVVVNAAAEEDLDVVVSALRKASGEAGKRYLYRTGAAFVSAWLGIPQKAPITLQQLGIEQTTTGGLIIAGSYVPKTTSQLQTLQERNTDGRLVVIVLDVETLLSDSARVEIVDAVSSTKEALLAGKDVLVMTSRKLVVGADEATSLDIGTKVAESLMRFLEGLDTKPRYIIAKGGITSSDMASKSLRMKRALIVGQAAPGVPLWRCDEETSKWPGIPYVVFPGNVGTNETLADLVEAWRSPA